MHPCYVNSACSAWLPAVQYVCVCVCVLLGRRCTRVLECRIVTCRGVHHTRCGRPACVIVSSQPVNISTLPTGPTRQLRSLTNGHITATVLTSSRGNVSPMMKCGMPSMPPPPPLVVNYCVNIPSVLTENKCVKICIVFLKGRICFIQSNNDGE